MKIDVLQGYLDKNTHTKECSHCKDPINPGAEHLVLVVAKDDYSRRNILCKKCGLEKLAATSFQLSKIMVALSDTGVKKERVPRKRKPIKIIRRHKKI